MNARLRLQAAQFLKRITGSAPYDLHVHGMKHTLPVVQANSDLTGVGFDLPAPFGKAQGEPMPFSFTFQPMPEGPDDANAPNDQSNLQDARLMFGPVQAHYLLQQIGQAQVLVDPQNPAEPMNMRTRLRVVHGAIGVNKPADLPSQGVSTAVDLNELDADAWRKVFADINANAQAEALAAADAPRPPMSDTVTTVPAEARRHPLHDAQAARPALGKCRDRRERDGSQVAGECGIESGVGLSGVDAGRDKGQSRRIAGALRQGRDSGQDGERSGRQGDSQAAAQHAVDRSDRQRDRLPRTRSRPARGERA